MRRSTVLSLPPQLVFPAYTYGIAQYVSLVYHIMDKLC
jgi:hypothetical protein